MTVGLPSKDEGRAEHKMPRRVAFLFLFLTDTLYRPVKLLSFIPGPESNKALDDDSTPVGVISAAAHETMRLTCR